MTEQDPEQNVHFSSTRQDWATPPDIFATLDRDHGPFDLDAAASAENTKCPRYWTEDDDALTKPWDGRVFCNPPYKRAADFVEKAIREVQAGRAEIVVLLVPARTDTTWFREAYEHAEEMKLLSGRITFEGAPGPAPFPSCVIVLRRPQRWNSNDGKVTYTMPARHGTRPRWYSTSGGQPKPVHPHTLRDLLPESYVRPMAVRSRTSIEGPKERGTTRRRGGR